MGNNITTDFYAFGQAITGLEFVSFSNPKYDKEEYVIFKIQRDDIDLNDYLFYDNTYNDDHHLSNRQRHMYRFPKGINNVKRGQIVRVFTGRPEGHEDAKNWRSVDKDSFDRVRYNFYWGIDHNVWNKTGDKITLVCVKDIDTQVLNRTV